MFRRNPDLLAVVAIALYVALGNAGPAFDLYGDLPPGPALREQIQDLVRSEANSILRELDLTIHK